MLKKSSVSKTPSKTIVLNAQFQILITDTVAMSIYLFIFVEFFSLVQIGQTFKFHLQK